MNEITMIDIEQRCNAARNARLVLKMRAEALQEEIADAQKRKLPGIRSAAEAVAQADKAVLDALQLAPGLFKRPKSAVFHGLQVGYKKGTGSIEMQDADQVVKLIRKHLADKFDQLVKVKETPIKSAIRELSGVELKKIGVTVQDTGEVVFLKDAVDEVDKLVKALLKGAEAEIEEEAEA
jgi:NhaP-type Na+/H+ and K+/H+ antiporter